MTLTINPVLCRPETMDNYAYIITDSATGQTAVIDASEATPVIEECTRLNLRPNYILTTHHHFDHVGGNLELKQKYGLKIVAPFLERNTVEGADLTLADGESFDLGKSRILALSAPGHTLGHNLYYLPEDKILFTGDVLFNLSIGGLFEGTPEQMWNTLQKIKSLPDDVLFYPGHEYTKFSLARALEHGDNPPLEIYARIVSERLNHRLPAAPVTLGLEKQCNPYLRLTDKKAFARLF